MRRQGFYISKFQAQSIAAQIKKPPQGENFCTVEEKSRTDVLPTKAGRIDNKPVSASSLLLKAKRMGKSDVPHIHKASYQSHGISLRRDGLKCIIEQGVGFVEGRDGRDLLDYGLIGCSKEEGKVSKILERKGLMEEDGGILLGTTEENL